VESGLTTLTGWGKSWPIALAMLERHTMVAHSGSFSMLLGLAHGMLHFGAEVSRRPNGGAKMSCSASAVFVASWIVMLTDSTSSFIPSNHLLFGLLLLLFPCTWPFNACLFPVNDMPRVLEISLLDSASLKISDVVLVTKVLVSRRLEDRQ